MMATLAFNELMAFQEFSWVSSVCGRICPGGTVRIFGIDAPQSLYFVFWFTRSSACHILQTLK